MRPLLPFAVVLLLAGCFDGKGTPETAGDVPVPIEIPEIVFDHDHDDPILHTTSAGLSLYGFTGANELLPGETARLSDIQFFDSYAAVTVNGRGGASSGGFLLLDIESAAAPRLLSRYHSGSEDNWYTKFTPDGKYVLVTANGNTNPNDLAGGAQQNAAGGMASAPLRGIHIVDVANKENPVRAGFYPAPYRVVNLATWVGRDKVTTYVAASMVYDPAGASGPAPTHDANYVGIYRLVPATGATGPMLEEVARWHPTDAPEVARAFPHDLAFGLHPKNGKHLLFVAYWDAGAYIVDVSDPVRPAQASRIRPLGAEDHVHTFKPHPYLIGGEYYAVTSPETFGGESIGTYRVFNISEARAPTQVAAWSPAPDLRNQEPLLFSPHEFGLANERLYASQFHGGVWVLKLPDLTPLSTWQAARGTPRTSIGWAVTVASTVWYSGHVWAVDMDSGLFVLDEDQAPFVGRLQ